MILEIGGTLDAFQSRLSDVMAGVEGLEFKGCEYMDNSSLRTYWLSPYTLSRSRYHVSQAESAGKLEEIQNHVDPIGIRGTASKKISKGFLRSHRHEVNIYGISLSRLEKVREDVDPGPELHGQKLEVIGDFCDNDHETAMEYYWTVEEELAQRY